MLSPKRIAAVCAVPLVVAAAVVLVSCDKTHEDRAPEENPAAKATRVDLEQVPKWSANDMDFFLHGSMGSEFLPVAVHQAFCKTYPELFSGTDFSWFGLLENPGSHDAVGISARDVPHLGGMSSYGINCASCHVAEFVPSGGGQAVRVLGVTSHFDVEAFYNTIILATFKTADLANMEKFLMSYYFKGGPNYGTIVMDPQNAGKYERFYTAFERLLTQQRAAIAKTIQEDPTGEKGAGPGGLHELKAEQFILKEEQVEKKEDLTLLVKSFLKLFHNMRAALHVPDKPPEKLPPASGPGRNTAFGLLSYSLLGIPKEYAPSKFGVVWNMKDRYWNHWDGNSSQPTGRNVLAALGLGAPLVGKHGYVDMALINRQTELTEQIRAPKYPFQIDDDRAKRGAGLYKTNCASCHDLKREDEDKRLIAVSDVKTDPARARIFDEEQARLYNKFFSELEIPGYKPPETPTVRSTGKYVAAPLSGVWARAPYLHNGSVPSMWDLLSPVASRPKSFKRGTRKYDTSKLGFVDEGAYLFNTASPGNSNAGHEYGAELTEEHKRDLVEFLKTK